VLTPREKDQLQKAQQWIDKGFEFRLNAGLAKLQTSIDTAIAIAKELAPIVAKYANMQKPAPEMHKAPTPSVSHPRPRSWPLPLLGATGRGSAKGS
jgi:hypothetical protein